MRGQRYRLTKPTIAVLFVESQKAAVTIPAGAEVRALNDPEESNPFMDFEWEDQLIEMFVQDIRERGELICEIPS